MKAALGEAEKKGKEIAEKIRKEIGSEHSENMQPTRCYAFLLQKGMETRLLVQPARTFEEMSEKAATQNGAGWSIAASAFVDVFAPAQNITMPAGEEKKPVEAPQLGNFIHTLEYSRDKFAEDESEQSAINKIISTIRKNYDRSDR